MLSGARQQREHQSQSQIYVSNNLDLAQLLDGEPDGTYKAIFGNQAFSVVVQEGHSIKSLIPIGYEPNWVVIPQPNAQPAQFTEQEQQLRRSRANA